MSNKYPYIKLEHSNPTHSDWFVVNWCLGNTCNYECSYCPSGLHDSSKRWPSIDVIKNFITNIKKANPEKKLYFEFTGGEVTLYKDFIDVCKFNFMKFVALRINCRACKRTIKVAFV